jgi:type II restriction/modification system DNA methylase subunit YeeA
MKSDVDAVLARSAKDEAAKTKRWRRAHEPLKTFLDRLREVTVLDPACGSGNFLYVTLQSLKNLERDVILWGAMTLKTTTLFPRVGPHVVRGIELNTYAAELARVSIWIGEIQWMLNNGFAYQRNPILRPLNNIECRDAILDRANPDEPMEAKWPSADFIVGNPPHKHNKHMRESGMTDEYVRDLFDVYKGRVGAESDYACYWFEKARQNVEDGITKRVGLIGPQGIRGGANRKILDRIKKIGDIFLAWSDRPWVLDGAQTHVSIVGFDDGTEQERFRDGVAASSINADLTVGIDLTKVPRLVENLGISFMGDTPGGKFSVSPELAKKMLDVPNPHGKPNSDVVVPWVNGSMMKNPREAWIIDFGVRMTEDEAALYEAPFEYVKAKVAPNRKVSRTTIEQWWLHERPRPDMRQSLAGLRRFIGTVCHSKHRIYFWIDRGSLPNNGLIVFARSDDYFFGVLQSRIHSVWSLAKGTQVREKETGFRYTPTTTFETFPLPRPSEKQSEAVAKAAKALETFRQGWLKPKTGPRRTLTQLYSENPTWLKQAHERLDQAVTAAYGWPTNPSDDEILSRVLTLNAQRKPVVQGAAEADEEGADAPEA